MPTISPEQIQNMQRQINDLQRRLNESERLLSVLKRILAQTHEVDDMLRLTEGIGS